MIPGSIFSPKKPAIKINAPNPISTYVPGTVFFHAVNALLYSSTKSITPIPFTERKVKAQEMNAGSQRINANRPRPAPQPRQPRAATDEERLEAAYNTPVEKRSEYQKSLIARKERVGKGPGRNSERREVTPPAPRVGWGVKPL
jgi:hypothetical protein